jgi:hypothetical protein
MAGKVSVRIARGEGVIGTVYAYVKEKTMGSIRNTQQSCSEVLYAHSTFIPPPLYREKNHRLITIQLVANFFEEGIITVVSSPRSWWCNREVEKYV